MNRDEKKAQTRQAILDAAKSLFEAAGFDGASIRAIAGEAGVAAGTVLLHFEDKRDLLHSALFDDAERAVNEALAAVPQGGPLEAQLAHITRRMFAYYEARPALSRVLLKESLFAEAPWAERFTGQVTRVHARLTELIGRAVERGEVAEETNVDRLAVAYFSFYYFALISWVQGAFPHPIGLVDNLMKQHLDGVRPPEA